MLNLFIEAKYFKISLILSSGQICLQGSFIAIVHFFPIIYEHMNNKSIIRENRLNYESDKKLLSKSNLTTKSSVPSLP